MMLLDQSKYEDAVSKIIDLNRKCANFWSNAHGWAPAEAAELLSKSRLDWQVSLSETLFRWTPSEGEVLSDGSLILGWANLGALTEGTLKLMLSVYYADFSNDIEALKASGAFDRKKQTHKVPDVLKLEEMRVFLSKKKLFEPKFENFILLVQHRRNAIHAYKDREIGTLSEFRTSVVIYLEFLETVEMRLPYP